MSGHILGAVPDLVWFLLAAGVFMLAFGATGGLYVHTAIKLGQDPGWQFHNKRMLYEWVRRNRSGLLGAATGLFAAGALLITLDVIMLGAFAILISYTLATWVTLAVIALRGVHPGAPSLQLDRDEAIRRGAISPAPRWVHNLVVLGFAGIIGLYVFWEDAPGRDGWGPFLIGPAIMLIGLVVGIARLRRLRARASAGTGVAIEQRTHEGGLRPIDSRNIEGGVETRLDLTFKLIIAGGIMGAIMAPLFLWQLDPSLRRPWIMAVAAGLGLAQGGLGWLLLRRLQASRAGTVPANHE